MSIKRQGALGAVPKAAYHRPSRLCPWGMSLLILSFLVCKMRDCFLPLQQEEMEGKSLACCPGCCSTWAWALQ